MIKELDLVVMEKINFSLSAKSMNRYTSELHLKRKSFFIKFSFFGLKNLDIGQSTSGRVDGKEFHMPEATIEEKKIEQDFTVFSDIE